MKRGGLIGDGQWSPRCQQVLQGALRGSGGHQVLSEQYWSQPVHRWPMEARPEDGWWLKGGARSYQLWSCRMS